MTPAHHGLHGGPREAKGRRQIERDHLIPRLVAELDQKVVARDAGIGYEDVELAQGVLAGWHQGLDRILVSEVAGEHVDATGKLAGERVERITARPRDRNVCTLRMQRARNRATDPAACAGDESALASQVEHHRPPLIHVPS